MKKDAKPYMSTVKIGPKGQIVIPKEVRDMFDIGPGESVVIMAHPERGIGIMKQDALIGMADAIFAGKGKEVLPYEDQSNLEGFAGVVKENIGNGGEK